MKYLFVISGTSFGGLELITVKKALSAIENNNEVLVACYENSRVDDYAKSLNINTVYFKIYIPYFDISATVKFGTIYNDFNPDVVIVSSTKLLNITINARLISKWKPSIILFQQMQSGIKKKDIIHNYIYNRLDGAIVLTNLMKEMLIETTVLKKEKIHVVHYGVDIDKFKNKSKSKLELRNKYNLPENKYIFGYVARIDEHKDQLTAIRAFKQASIEESVLVFTGSIEDEQRDYYRKLQDEIEKLDIKERVFFIGFTQEMPELMNCFDVFIMPSRSETFGLVIIEAMASGLPVIAVKSGGVPEIIEDRKNGLLFEQSDYIRMSELMNEVYQDIEIRNHIVEAGYSVLEEKFDNKEQIVKFLAVCTKIHFLTNRNFKRTP